MVYLQCALLLHGWCHVKKLPPWRVLRTLYNHALCQSLHAKRHAQDACVFSCNLPSALLAERPGTFTCYNGNTGVERIPKQETAQKVDPGENNYPAAPAGM